MFNEEPTPCKECGHQEWGNPKPVVVVIQETTSNRVVLIRRNIPPGIGELALPGGFVDEGETMFEAAEREMLEETGIVQTKFEFLSTCMTAHNNMLLFVKALTPVVFADRGKMTTPHEIQEVVETPTSVPLCFPSHQDALDRHFGLV